MLHRFEIQVSHIESHAIYNHKPISHFEWINKPRKQGGLGEMKIPVLADRNQKISRDYGVLKEDEGIAYRSVFDWFKLDGIKQF